MSDEKKLSLNGLQIVRARWINGRLVCDVINDENEVVLSGNADWVVDLCFARNYYIENWQDAVAKLDALNSSWGTY